MMLSVPRVLTVAGSDSGGGAGIQADLKTFTRYCTYGMSAITALTAQNTVGVQGVHSIPADFVAAQIDSVLSDIGVDAAKTGMLADSSVVQAVAERVSYWEMRPLVVDPVMVAKSGDHLLAASALEVVVGDLLPLTTVLTPNISEAEALLDEEINDLHDMREAAEGLRQMGPGIVVVKGGHLCGHAAVDVYCDHEGTEELSSEWIETENTHGTGCTFASAIAAGLARGWPPLDAVRSAKSYVTRAIGSALPLGSGHGPTDHLVSPDWPEQHGGD